LEQGHAQAQIELGAEQGGSMYGARGLHVLDEEAIAGQGHEATQAAVQPEAAKRRPSSVCGQDTGAVEARRIAG